MPDVLLHEGEQDAVRAIIGWDPVPSSSLPAQAIMHAVSELIACDAIGIARLDCPVPIGQKIDQGQPTAGDVDSAESHVIGIQELDHVTASDGSPGGPGVAVLALGVRNDPHHVLQLWMSRRRGRFTERDRALLELVAPALERILRERPMSTLPPSLTVAERRVLLHVAQGLSNDQIAEVLVVASSTVRKHLEHAYRKLGVTNRLAAIYAIQRTSAREADPSVWVEPAAHPSLGR